MAVLEGGKISGRQFIALTVLTRILAILLEAPTISGTDAGHDVWIAVLISTFLVLPWVFIWVHLAKMFPGRTIIQYSQEILGPWLGRLVGFIFIVFFLQQSAHAVRVAADAYVTTIMPETPLIVFILIMTFLSSNCARSGLEVLARAADIVFPLVLVLLVLILVLPINNVDLLNLLPVAAYGWGSIVEATFSSFAVFGELVVMTMLFPYLDEAKGAGGLAVRTVLLAGFLFTWFSIIVALVFGPAVGSLILPAFSLSRAIEFAFVVERVEVIPLVAWTLGAGVKQTVFLWASMLGIAQLFNLSEMKSLAYPVGALVASFAVWLFSTIFDALQFYTAAEFGPLGVLVCYVIPLILYVGALIRQALRPGKGEEGRM
ncbi:MAG: endospore germination permease [Firmicutes bacterium]|nr:endospore germination permease [Bacillota bacterium]